MEASNKLIAEFMQKGSKGFGIYDFDGCFYNLSELKFNCSWDWLMPVVEKIESYERYDVDILQYGTRISDNQKEIVNNIANTSFDTKIDHTYQAVVEFIKEYNLNN